MKTVIAPSLLAAAKSLLAVLVLLSAVAGADQSGPDDGPPPQQPGPGYITAPPEGGPVYDDPGAIAPRLPLIRPLRVGLDYYCAIGNCQAPRFPAGRQLFPQPIPAPADLEFGRCDLVEVGPGLSDLILNGHQWLYRGPTINGQILARYYVGQRVCIR